MKRISKGLRSLSPFSRKQNGHDSESVDSAASKTNMTTAELDAPDDENISAEDSADNNTVDKYTLNWTSFEDFLVYFYSKYNPEKISMIDYIAQQYRGDEMVMISNLALKYQLGHPEMQRLIDSSRRQSPKKQLRPPPSDTDSEPESEPNSEPTVSELSTSSLRQGGYSPYLPAAQQRGRKGVSFSGANSVRTFDRNASPLRSAPPSTSTTPASLQDIITRNRQQEQAPKSTLANKSLLGHALLSPGAQKPSPGLRSPSPTVGKGGGPRPHPAPVRASSPLQNLVRSQELGPGLELGEDQAADPAAQQRLLNQKMLREKMMQNQQEETLAQQRQHLLQQQAQLQSHQLQQQQYQEQPPQQQPQQTQQKSLQQVVREDEQFLAQQVRGLSSGRSREGQPAQLDHDSSLVRDYDRRTPQQQQQQQQQQVVGESAGRTQTVHIEEIKLELARTRQALSEADRERDEVLRLLEEMAAAPLQMKSVVEQYLDNRSRSASVQHSQDGSVCSDAPSSPSYQPLLQQQQQQERPRRGISSGSSVDSHASSLLRGSLRDLGPDHPSPRSFSPGGGSPSKSYMLGTASSSKRETGNAHHGGKTGAFNIHASGNGRLPNPMFERPSAMSLLGAGASVRSSSTGGQQFGQRFIRPSSATASSSRGRSASPASSEYGSGRGVRASSPASSITSAEVERQYIHTKQRIDSNTQQSRSTQQASQRQIEQTAKDAALERQRAKTSQESPGRPRPVAAEVTDWVVCEDPKSHRKYYYSRNLGKSTWTPPPQFAAAASSAAATNSNGTPTRPSSAGSRGSARGSAGWRGNSPGGGSTTSSVAHSRAASPAGSTASASSRGPVSGGPAVWKSARDPKSGRTYWFNRKTRESTWKNPFESS